MIYHPGMVVIVTGVQGYDGGTPPKLALIDSVNPEDYVVRLRMGGMGLSRGRFAKKSRQVKHAQVSREASARELELGQVVEQ